MTKKLPCISDLRLARQQYLNANNKIQIILLVCVWMFFKPSIPGRINIFTIAIFFFLGNKSSLVSILGNLFYFVQGEILIFVNIPVLINKRNFKECRIICIQSNKNTRIIKFFYRMIFRIFILWICVTIKRSS